MPTKVPTTKPETVDLYSDGNLLTGWYWNPDDGEHILEFSAEQRWKQTEEIDNNTGILGNERV